MKSPVFEVRDFSLDIAFSLRDIRLNLPPPEDREAKKGIEGVWSGRGILSKQASNIELVGAALALWSCLGGLAPGQAPAPAGSGVQAGGTVNLAGPRGSESGTITISAWGADHCKIEIQLGPPILRRTYTAVMNGKRVVASGPVGLIKAVPLPLAPAIGCALLPEGLALAKVAGGSVALTTDQATGLPATLSWTERGQARALAYSGYQTQAGLPLAGTVTESVDGSPRLSVRLTSIAAQAFSEGDFVVPPPKRAAARKAGGAQ